jgi:putative nucleotidyltransferase with HDIG domain
MKKEQLIDVKKLTPGIYVELPLNWSQHPFFFSRFKIKNWAEVRQIQALGLDRVPFVPAKSDVKATDPGEAKGSYAKSTPSDTEDFDLWQQKQHSIEQADQFRRDRKKIAQRYHETKKRISNLMSNLTMAPANAVRDSESLIEDLTAQFTKESNMLINLVNMSPASYNSSNHALNVTVLALLLGHSMGLTKEELNILGMGTLLHDIGKVALPARIAKNAKNMTKAEQDLFSTHVGQGIKLVHRIDDIRPEVMEIIGHHHSFLDGTGFPQQVSPEKISQLARIVTIANLYDNYCNPSDPANAVTPKDAMAHIYAQAGEQLDQKLVQTFIRTFGVFPPGTVVLLTDNSVGLVVVVSPKTLLTPRVVLYNPDIPADKAMVIDLAEHPNLQIVKALRPTDYPSRIYNYLGIQEQVGYYFETLGQE